MGDYFQIIVDQDATVSQAEILAFKVEQWLIGEGIIEAVATNDCILGDGLGYPPGINCIKAIKDVDLFAKDLWTDGLKIITERTVFHPGQGSLEGVTCLHCGTYIADEAHFKTIMEVIDDWYSGNEGKLICPNCGFAASITKWLFEPTWGFGNLGFKFWNWPPLKESFVANIEQLLGHRVILVFGKL